MIINKTTKGVIERNDKPNENWTGNDEKYYLVDSNSDLAQKIRENAPYFEYVLNESGELVDITPTERPEPPIEEEEPTIEDMLLEMDYRLTCVELGL